MGTTGSVLTRMVGLFVVVVALLETVVVASEQKGDMPTWSLVHHQGHHHHHDHHDSSHRMVDELCGDNDEGCDFDRLFHHMMEDAPFWSHNHRPCDKSFSIKYPRHSSVKNIDIEGSEKKSITFTSLFQEGSEEDGPTHQKLVLIVHPLHTVLGRRGGPFPIDLPLDVEGENTQEIMKSIIREMMDKGEELRNKYVSLMSEATRGQWAGKDRMASEEIMHEYMRNVEQRMGSDSASESKWKEWVRDFFSRMHDRISPEPASNDSMMLSLQNIDWRLWDDNDCLNTGLVLFIALLCTSLVIWTSLMIQLAQHIVYYYRGCPSGYDQLDTKMASMKEKSPSETDALLKGQEPTVH